MIVDLPEPEPSEQDAATLIDCIQSRRSVRTYSEGPISLAQLSQLLWVAQGHTGPDQKRTAPSAGGQYPLHLHVVARRVTELASGVYEYDRDRHSLRLLEDTLVEADITAAGIGDQPWLSECAVIIGVAARMEECVEHFADQPPQGERGNRYVYLEAGAVTQNVHLQATALRLGCVLVAGFHDSHAAQALRLAGSLHPVALLCVGHQRGD